MSFVGRYGPWGLVAGASEGLGAAWAHALARRGLKLLLLARRAEVLEQTAQQLRAQHGVEVHPLAVDLAAPELLDRLTPALQGREVGFYVHNAAYVPHGPFLGQPSADQAKSVDVNCRVPVLLAHLLAESMAARGRGGIVLMSSLTAFQGTPLLATYGATKGFNLALAEALHTELRPRGVDVLACCAGATRTPGFLRSAPKGAPGELQPEQVVEEALSALGRGAFVIPGRFNRFASFLMRRLLPRASTVRILAQQTRQLQAGEPR